MEGMSPFPLHLNEQLSLVALVVGSVNVPAIYGAGPPFPLVHLYLEDFSPAASKTPAVMLLDGGAATDAYAQEQRALVGTVQEHEARFPCAAAHAALSGFFNEAAQRLPLADVATDAASEAERLGLKPRHLQLPNRHLAGQSELAASLALHRTLAAQLAKTHPTALLLTEVPLLPTVHESDGAIIFAAGESEVWSLEAGVLRAWQAAAASAVANSHLIPLLIDGDALAEALLSAGAAEGPAVDVPFLDIVGFAPAGTLIDRLGLPLWREHVPAAVLMQAGGDDLSRLWRLVGGELAEPHLDWTALKDAQRRMNMAADGGRFSIAALGWAADKLLREVPLVSQAERFNEHDMRKILAVHATRLALRGLRQEVQRIAAGRGSAGSHLDGDEGDSDDSVHHALSEQWAAANIWQHHVSAAFDAVSTVLRGWPKIMQLQITRASAGTAALRYIEAHRKLLRDAGAPFPSFFANTSLVVLATNVAETSITIDGVHTVVDLGMHKDLTVVPPGVGIAALLQNWISRSSANQRSGRCGRTAAPLGMRHVVYRLYSRPFLARLPAFPTPTVLRYETSTLVAKVLQLATLYGWNNGLFDRLPTPSAEAATAAAVVDLDHGAAGEAALAVVNVLEHTLAPQAVPALLSHIHLAALAMLHGGLLQPQSQPPLLSALGQIVASVCVGVTSARFLAAGALLPVALPEAVVMAAMNHVCASGMQPFVPIPGNTAHWMGGRADSAWRVSTAYQHVWTFFLLSQDSQQPVLTQAAPVARAGAGDAGRQRFMAASDHVFGVRLLALGRWLHDTFSPKVVYRIKKCLGINEEFLRELRCTVRRLALQIRRSPAWFPADSRAAVDALGPLTLLVDPRAAPHKSPALGRRQWLDFANDALRELRVPAHSALRLFTATASQMRTLAVLALGLNVVGGRTAATDDAHEALSQMHRGDTAAQRASWLPHQTLLLATSAAPVSWTLAPPMLRPGGGEDMEGKPLHAGLRDLLLWSADPSAAAAYPSAAAAYARSRCRGIRAATNTHVAVRVESDWASVAHCLQSTGSSDLGVGVDAAAPIFASIAQKAANPRGASMYGMPADVLAAHFSGNKLRVPPSLARVLNLHAPGGATAVSPGYTPLPAAILAMHSLPGGVEVHVTGAPGIPEVAPHSSIVGGLATGVPALPNMLVEVVAEALEEVCSGDEEYAARRTALYTPDLQSLYQPPGAAADDARTRATVKATPAFSTKLEGWLPTWDDVAAKPTQQRVCLTPHAMLSMLAPPGAPAPAPAFCVFGGVREDISHFRQRMGRPPLGRITAATMLWPSAAVTTCALVALRPCLRMTVLVRTASEDVTAAGAGAERRRPRSGHVFVEKVAFDAGTPFEATFSVVAPEIPARPAGPGAAAAVPGDLEGLLPLASIVAAGARGNSAARVCT
jgi:hypothetical protein